jgi:hypothetical protein
MNKSPATKKRIIWGRVLKRMKEQGSYGLDVANYFPMLLKRSFLDAPYVHTKNRQKVRYRLLRRLD